MREEARTILRMVEQHAVSVEDARKLLIAIGERVDDQGVMNEVLERLAAGDVTLAGAVAELETPPVSAPENGDGRVQERWLRILVQEYGRDRVNVRIPLRLVDTGLRLLKSMPGSPVRIKGVPVDMDALWASVRGLDLGKMLEVEGDDGAHIVIAIEV